MNTVWRINLEIAVIKQSIPWSRRVGTSVQVVEIRSGVRFSTWILAQWRNDDGHDHDVAMHFFELFDPTEAFVQWYWVYNIVRGNKGTHHLPAACSPSPTWGVRPPLCSAPTSALVLSYRHCTTANYDCPNFFSLTVATSLAAIRAVSTTYASEGCRHTGR